MPPTQPQYEKVGNVFVLRGGLLVRQVFLMYNEETRALEKINFRSDQSRREHLAEIRLNKEEAVDLLIRAGLMKEKIVPSDVQEMHEMVNEYLAYIEIAVGFGITCVKNFFVRKKYLDKVKMYAGDKITEMYHLLNRARARPLTESELQSARSMVMELRAFKGIAFNQVVKEGADISSQRLAQLVKPSLSFHDEIRRVQMQLVNETGDNRFALPFEELKHKEKIKVYLQYVKTAHQDPQIPATVIDRLGLVGVGLLLFTAGMSCWDIYLSKTKFRTAVKEGAEFGSGYFAGGWAEYLWHKLVDGVESKIVRAIGAAEVVEAPALGAALLGAGTFLFGIAGGIIAAKIAGYVVDKIFDSGGKHAGGAFNENNHGHQVPKPPEIVNATAYRVSMPDASALARRIAIGDLNPSVKT